MNEVFQIPRTSLIWVLAALTSVILPHLGRMPIWLTLLCIACITTRIFIFQGRLSYPGSLIKTTIVLLTAAAVVLQFGRDVFSTDSTVSMLIVGIALKLLEMQKKGEVLLVIYLCYFTIVAEFIYSQSIPIAIYMLCCVILCTSALMSLTQTQEYQRPLRTVKLSAMILGQSIPLMLVLFLIFPRISPLWNVPIQSSAAVSGLSDRMSPGDIGELTRIADVAFRVKFNSEPLVNSELYWRGLTLDTFDGREWRRRRGGFNNTFQRLGPRELNQDRQGWFDAIEYLSDIADYNIILEPTYQNWLFTLKIPQINKENLIMRRDFQVENVRNISQRYSYDARSYLDNRIGLEIGGNERERMVQIPSLGNQQSSEFAGQLRASVETDQEYIQLILNYFREEQFFYTLSPLLLGENSIDEFLFETREGFCEHYASTFSFLMRAAGIPSRIVTGYQGGEFNPYDETLIVRQYDAHAWSEVWLEGEGWIRVDATAAVAPQRIDLGSQLTFQADVNFLEDAGLSLLRFRNSLFLNDLRFRLEMIDYAWNRFVLNYDQELQFDLLSRFFGVVTQEKIVFTLLALLILFLGIPAFFVLKTPVYKELNPATKLYLHYCAFLAKLGFVRLPGETPRNFCNRISSQKPQWSNEMGGITDTFMDITFESIDEEHKNSEKVKRLKEKIKKFRLMK